MSSEQATDRNRASSRRRASMPLEADIRGYLDGIEGRRQHGWAWDRNRPGERLEIFMRIDGSTVASRTADRARIDLRSNGIGDGRHAFEIDIPEGIDESVRPSIVARSPSTGIEMELAFSHPSDRPAAEPQLTGVMAQLHELADAQRQSQAIQRAAVEALRRTVQQVETVCSSEGALGSVVAMARDGQGDLAQRMAESERFLVRIDATLAGLDQQVKTLSNTADRPMRRAAVLLCVLSGLAAFSGLSLLALALLHRLA